MDLPAELENAFREDFATFEQEKTMRYVTSIERLARKEGVEEGLQEGLQLGYKKCLYDAVALNLQGKFGVAGVNLVPFVRAVDDEETLRALLLAVPTATTLEEVRRLLPAEAKADGDAS